MEVPAGKCIHDLVEEQAHRSPDATAVIYRGQGLTYRELDEKAERLARAFRDGCGTGDDRRECAERSPEMMVSMLAILKSGGAYADGSGHPRSGRSS